jgi:trehalose/maltose hydrolase-like predicted phosphorylase
VELDKRVYLIIELKYCSESFHLSQADKNSALADESIFIIPKPERNEILAQEIRKKLTFDEFEKAISQEGLIPSTRTQAYEILANKALDYLSKTEFERALAEAVKLTLSAEKIKDIEKKAAPKVKRTDQEIDDILTKATQKALNDIAQRGYHHILDHMASEFIDLGLAIYGTTPKIKAAFGTH